MTTPQTTQRSALKDARLLHKLGKRLGMPGTGLARIIAALQAMRAAADRDPSTPAVQSPPLALRADMTLDELLSVVDGMQPLAGSIAAWHKPQPIALTEQMQALSGSLR